MGGNPFLEARHASILRKARALPRAQMDALDHLAATDVAAAGRRSLALLAKAGLLRHVVPRAFGGSSPALEARAIIAAREGIAYGSGLADAIFAVQGLGSVPLTLGGTAEQQKEWLPKVARGRAIGAFAVTEPEAGSDVASMTTRATRTPRGWELNGAKTFTSNAGIADYYLLFAKSDPAAGPKGISCFLLPAGARGLRVEPLRLLAPHPLGTLRLRRVRLPLDALVGAEGEGYKLALRTLDFMRPSVAAAAVGLAQRGLDAALGRARERKQFGRPIGDNQGLRWRLAEASTELEAARLLVHRAAWLKDTGQERITLEAAQAKLLATETAQRVIDLALQVHGGSGVLAGSLVERLYREIRALRIYEGSSEILRDIIGRHLLDGKGA